MIKRRRAFCFVVKASFHSVSSNKSFPTIVSTNYAHSCTFHHRRERPQVLCVPPCVIPEAVLVARVRDGATISSTSSPLSSSTAVAARVDRAARPLGGFAALRLGVFVGAGAGRLRPLVEGAGAMSSSDASMTSSASSNESSESSATAVIFLFRIEAMVAARVGRLFVTGLLIGISSTSESSISSSETTSTTGSDLAVDLRLVAGARRAGRLGLRARRFRRLLDDWF